MYKSKITRGNIPSAGMSAAAVVPRVTRMGGRVATEEETSTTASNTSPTSDPVVDSTQPQGNTTDAPEPDDETVEGVPNSNGAVGNDAAAVLTVVNGATSSEPVARGRAAGVQNYKKLLLYNVISRILPASGEAWERTAAEYQKAAQESEIRSGETLKVYFTKTMCQNGRKKPTGSTEIIREVKMAQLLQEEILRKSYSLDYGCSDDYGDEFADSSPDDPNHSPPDAALNVSSIHRPRNIDDQKTKNSRPSNPRGGAMTQLTDAITSAGAANSQNQMFQMMMQNQQQLMGMVMAMLQNSGRGNEGRKRRRTSKPRSSNNRQVPVCLSGDSSDDDSSA